MTPDALRVPVVHTGATWRAALTLSLYRSAIAFGLVATLSAGGGQGLFSPDFPGLFRAICLAYLALAACLAGAALVRRPPLAIHVFVQILVDVVLIVLASYAGNGASGGIAMLLLAPLAAAGILLPARLSGLLTALAALGMIGQEIMRHWQLADAHTDFVQSGILGALYFATAFMAYGLARRIRVSDASAASHASQARDLAELNRHIIDRMQTGAIVIDADDRIQILNHAALELLDHDDGVAPPAALAELPPALGEALAAWRRRRILPDMIEVAGRRLQPQFAALGNDQAPTLIFLDDARRASEQAQQMKLMALGRLTASIAHEIRNPLGAISHAEQLLAESSAFGTDDSRLLAMIHRHCQRIDRIISDVLGLARRAAQRPRTLELSAWVAEAVADYRETQDDPPRFIQTGDWPAGHLRFDPGQLRQVLFNLWDNSNRHARGTIAPGIELHAHLDANRNLVLDIIDDGPGIAPELLDRIAEPFFTTAADGTGLGLHIARELCEANGARLIPMNHAQGACFRILLPRMTAEGPSP
ncbi:sensor histidine kinase [Salinisphaera hydrothermalis]|uniref:histidine kinase n=1 Tax=Salinisphaera hydrothermalis (strain C41B8) TaxID=1304275 RepID=A0A084IP34_SALHC|nr:ATP-binding protein [Salinisphaera hydrothermalis]KEZ78468.1 sensor protein PilS [Salinisphaera hydrothermalis C41B8]